MDKSTGTKPDLRRESSKGRLYKGGFLQPASPGRAFKGLWIAKQYCSMDLNGDSFVQRRPGTVPTAPGRPLKTYESIPVPQTLGS